ncbi:MAG: GTP-binding protein, partial [Brooklawnia sp.]
MQKVRLIALTGFLGSGKTTTMGALAEHLEAQGETVALVTNDQGTELVDSAVAALSSEVTAEVTGGCYCCRFDDLALVLEDILAEGEASTIIIEAVGSCTDLQATVIRPLLKFYEDRIQVAPLFTVIDPDRYNELMPLVGSEDETDLAYLYDLQLAEANIIGINKDDTLRADEKEALVAAVKQRYPRAEVVLYSALLKRGLDTVAKSLDDVPAHWNVEIDYDRYAAAEAALAWLNLTVDLAATDEAGFGPATWVISALEHLAAGCAEIDATIGHIKIHLRSGEMGVTANLVGDGQPRLASASFGNVASGQALVNARVAMVTGDLDELVRAAI